MDGNPKIILALVWLIILNFFVAKLRALQLKQERVLCSRSESMIVSMSNSMSDSESVDLSDSQALSDSRGLLTELNARFGLKLNSLKRDFADGWQILRMVDVLQPSSYSVAKGSQFSNDHERLQFALACAESQLGIRQIIDADDIRRENLELRSLTVYLYWFLEKILEADLKAGLEADRKAKCDRIRRFVDKASASLANNNGLDEFGHEYVELRPVFQRIAEHLDADCLTKWMTIDRAFKRDKELFKLKLERRDSMQTGEHHLLPKTVTLLDNKPATTKPTLLQLTVQPIETNQNKPGTHGDTLSSLRCPQVNLKPLEVALIAGQSYLESVVKRRPTTICRLTVLISFSLWLFVLLPLFTNKAYFCRC